VVLTEGLNGPERQRKMVNYEVRAAKKAALVGKAAAGGPPASDHHGSARGVPAEVPQGLRGS
jgi:hypothetical protein